MKSAVLVILIAMIIGALTNVIILGIDYFLVGNGLHPYLTIASLTVSGFALKWLVEELKESTHAVNVKS